MRCATSDRRNAGKLQAERAADGLALAGARCEAVVGDANPPAAVARPSAASDPA